MQKLHAVDSAAEDQRHCAEHRTEPQGGAFAAEGRQYHGSRAEKLPEKSGQPAAVGQIDRHGVKGSDQRAQQEASSPQRRTAQGRRCPQKQVIDGQIQHKYGVDIDGHFSTSRQGAFRPTGGGPGCDPCPAAACGTKYTSEGAKNRSQSTVWIAACFFENSWKNSSVPSGNLISRPCFLRERRCRRRTILLPAVWP